VCWAGRKNSPEVKRQQTSAVGHTQPVMTSTAGPVTSEQRPMTSHHRDGRAAVGPMTSAQRPVTSQQGPMTSEQHRDGRAVATTADSMTNSDTTLYVSSLWLVYVPRRGGLKFGFAELFGFG